MDNGIDWDYLKYLPLAHPAKYETLVLTAQGYTYKEIEEKRFTAPGTVNNALTILYKAVGARNRAHLVHLAHQAGIL